MAVPVKHQVAVSADTSEQSQPQCQFGRVRPPEEVREPLRPTFLGQRQHVMVKEQRDDVVPWRVTHREADLVDHARQEAAVRSDGRPVVRSGRVHLHEIESVSHHDVHATALHQVGTHVVPQAVVVAGHDSQSASLDERSEHAPERRELLTAPTVRDVPCDDDVVDARHDQRPAQCLGGALRRLGSSEVKVREVRQREPPHGVTQYARSETAAFAPREQFENIQAFPLGSRCFTFVTCGGSARHSGEAVFRARSMSYWQQLLRIDAAILVGIRKWQAPGVTALMRTFTHLGDGSTWTFVALVLVAAGGEARHLGWTVALAAVFATVLSQTLKRVCRRPRPSSGIGGFTALAENPDAFSFPSGHTAAAFAVAIALAGQGQFLGPVQLGLAFAVAVSRVYLGAHYPLDVAAGVALGAIGGVLARTIL